MNQRRALRGHLVHCRYSPEHHPGALEQIADAVLWIEQGRVLRYGPAEHLLPQLPADCPLEDWRGCYILPGLIDTHVHYAQTDIIAAYGEQLLGWLEHYTFPAEARLADAQLAEQLAEFFLDELLRNGTTCAAVWATVHPSSVDALMMAAARRNMRLIAGKVLMDRHCPPALCESAALGEQHTRRLIERWHGHKRLAYAITPRFAPTSSREQLQRVGQLAAEYPDVYLQTHLAENRAEGQWVAQLFPEHQRYLAVYQHYGLLRPRAIVAHCVQLDGHEYQQLAEAGAAVAFCPSANLFLGSGLFDLAAQRASGGRLGLGTDVGAGTSLSLLRTLGDAYKVAQLRGYGLDAGQLLYLATLAGAQALDLESQLGNFLPGKEADLIVLDPQRSALCARRIAQAHSMDDALFALLLLADDRHIAARYLLGEPYFISSSC